MSLDAATFEESPTSLDVASNAFVSDPAATILKHAVKIWARSLGFAEDDISNLTERVVAFTCSAILDCQRKVQAVG